MSEEETIVQEVLAEKTPKKRGPKPKNKTLEDSKEKVAVKEESKKSEMSSKEKEKELLIHELNLIKDDLNKFANSIKNIENRFSAGNERNNYRRHSEPMVAQAKSLETKVDALISIVTTK